MSGDLSLGPPGTTVLTSDLEQFAQGVDSVREELESCASRLGFADRLVSDAQLWRVDAPYSQVRAEEAQSRARLAVADSVESCVALASGLRSVIGTYEELELRLSDAHRNLSGLVGYGVGWLLPGLALVAAPVLVPSLVGGAIGLGLLPERQRRMLVGTVLAIADAKAGILTDPATVELVRSVVSSADDGLAGLLRVPASVAALLGDDGLGLTGIASATAMIGGVAAMTGAFVETPVAVKPVTTSRDVAPAAGAADRIRRIPDGEEQIRIDTYSLPGQPDRVEVYIAGTASLDVVTGTQPLDMTSNITAMAGGSAGSARAVELALRDAGVTAQTPVVFTGYSQGGLVAAQLASSGDWNTVGLVTAGAPAGQAAVPHDVPYLAIEHTDDLVPALGGRFEHSQPLLAKREFAAGPVDTSERLLPAHALENYLRTAGMVDREPDARIRQLFDRLDAPGATVTSTLYRAERVVAGEDVG